jgi:hypothetical protein
MSLQTKNFNQQYIKIANTLVSNYMVYFKYSAITGGILGIGLSYNLICDLNENRKLYRTEKYLYPIICTFMGAWILPLMPVIAFIAPISYFFGTNIGKLTIRFLLSFLEKDKPTKDDKPTKQPNPNKQTIVNNYSNDYYPPIHPFAVPPIPPKTSLP